MKSKHWTEQRYGGRWEGEGQLTERREGEGREEPKREKVKEEET